jgi:hypothetical protein
MSLAKKLLERHNKLKSKTKIKESEEDTAALAPAAPQTDPKIVEAVKWLKESKWSESNETQGAACDQMKAIAESEDPESQKFMEYMDDCSSKYGESGAPTDEVPPNEVNEQPVIPEDDEDSEDDSDEDEDEVEEDDELDSNDSDEDEDSDEDIHDDLDTEDETGEDDSEDDEDDMEEDDLDSEDDSDDDSDEDEMEEDDLDSEDDDLEEDDDAPADDQEDKDDDEDDQTTEKFKKKK